jgi:glycosyltransferase involved in cell wall biosynthesis
MGRRGENLSILIPTYNCAKFLRETLASLRSQESDIAEAQIVVVDDCSTKDDPEIAARDAWGSRVHFFRQERNGGAINNFNTCVRLAERTWVHILHGDDLMLPSGYAAFREMIELFPNSAAVFARTVICDVESRWVGASRIIGPGSHGRLSYSALDWRRNLIEFAGALVRRDAYERVGTFDPGLTHVADWNMWWRLAKSEAVAYTNKCVGAYRIFEGNHTSTLMRTATNLSESVEQVGRMAQAIDPKDWPILYAPMAGAIMGQMNNYLDDREALKAHYRVLAMCPKGALPIVDRIRLLVKRWVPRRLWVRGM